MCVGGGGAKSLKYNEVQVEIGKHLSLVHNCPKNGVFSPHVCE